jgi:hypothetical protein
LTTKFTARTRAQIDKYAHKHGVSSGDVVRLAVADYLARAQPARRAKNATTTRRRVGG